MTQIIKYNSAGRAAIYVHLSSQWQSSELEMLSPLERLWLNLNHQFMFNRRGEQHCYIRRSCIQRPLHLSNCADNTTDATTLYHLFSFLKLSDKHFVMSWEEWQKSQTNRQTDRATDIATHGLNRPRGQLSEHLYNAAMPERLELTECIFLVTVILFRTS